MTEPDPLMTTPQQPGFFRRTGRGLTLILSWLLVLFLLVAAMVYLLYLFTPWQQTLKDILTGRLRTEITARTGVDDVALTLSDITLTGARLEDLRIGGEGGPAFGEITLTYDPHALWQSRRIDTVTITAPELTLQQDKSGWRVKGLALTPSEGSSPVSAALFNPVTFSGLPLDEARIEKGRLLIEGQTIKGQSNIEATSNFNDLTAALTLANLTLSIGKTDIRAETGGMQAAFDAAKSEWSGPWTLNGLSTGLTLGDPVPVLSGKGRFAVNAARATWSGTLTDAAGAWTASFTAALPLDGAAPSLTINTAALPWMGGRLTLASPMAVPLSGNKAIRADIRADTLSIDSLLQAATGSRVTATGTVSGTLPVTIKANGALDIGAGLLEAGGEGRLVMPPEALPGDNPQVGLLRDVMSDFHYTALSVETARDVSGKTALTLRVSGNNPAVQNGREVKLNVNLTGDILSLIQQNMLWMTDPRTLLRQQQQ